MKSASCLRRRRSHCCGCSRSERSSASAAVIRLRWTFVIDESWLARKQRKPSNGAAVTTLADGEKALIVAALQETHGRVAGPRGAAAKLGIPRQTLEWKIRNLNIDKLAFRDR